MFFSLVLCLLLWYVEARNYPKLESYNVDVASLSVSGLSSGGAQTNNFFVVNSQSVRGAAIFAGRPYGCSRVKNCENVDALLARARKHERDERIDSLLNIEGKNIYIYVWHGLGDGLVKSSHSENIRDFYGQLGASLSTNLTSPAGHGQPSLDYGIPCEDTDYPAINNCGWSGAFASLQHIYGDLQEPRVDQLMEGELIEFDQAEFTQGEPAHSMDEAAYVYIPTGCEDRETKCRIHVVFHGCKITRSSFGDEAPRHLGYNQVGELNNIIILYPQIVPDDRLGNSWGCWDNQGYTGDHYDTKNGVQNRIIKKIVDKIVGADPYCESLESNRHSGGCG